MICCGMVLETGLTKLISRERRCRLASGPNSGTHRLPIIASTRSCDDTPRWRLCHKLSLARRSGQKVKGLLCVRRPIPARSQGNICCPVTRTFALEIRIRRRILLTVYPLLIQVSFSNRPKQKMSVTSKREGPRDTVEESWDEHVLAQCYSLARRVTVKDFLDRFKSFLGISGRMWAATSGRSALRDALAGTRGHTGRPKKSVLICSFNCVAVCEAVLQAGFLAETFDLSDRSGRIDWDGIAQQLRSDHHAIVVPHLFGVPSDFRPILHAAANLGVLVI